MISHSKRRVELRYHMLLLLLVSPGMSISKIGLHQREKPVRGYKTLKHYVKAIGE
jgi:hypothetical protein